MSASAPIASQPRLWRRFVRGAVIALVVTAALLGWAIFRRPTQGAMLYWQYKAWHYAAPPDTVVYPARPVFQWWWAPPATVPDDDDDATGATDDGCVALPPHVVPPGGIGDPEALAKLNAYMDYTLPDNMQVLFCHGLRAPDGAQRLVVVAVGPRMLPGNNGYTMEAVLIAPATLTGLPRVVGRQRVPVDDARLYALPARFEAGQADPKDSSRFALSYLCAGERRTMQGRLLAGGKRIELAAP